MTNLRALALLLSMLAVLPLSGCAGGYFGPTGCHVDCRYCAAPPLPFLYYPECVCHSCQASPYLSLPSATTEPAGANDVDQDSAAGLDIEVDEVEPDN